MTKAFLTPEPSAYLSQKQRPLDNELFLSRARHSETRYRMMFVTQHQHLLQTVYFFRSCDICFQCFAFCSKAFHMPVAKRRQNKLKGFKFCTFIGRF